MKIASLQHPLIKHWCLLKKDAGYRKESKTLLIIGEKIIREYTARPIRCIISSTENAILAEKHYLVTEEMLQKITQIPSFQGMIAEVDLPVAQDVSSQNYLLVLDQIQDPGNLGTLFRSAFTLGWDAVVVVSGSVDLFNDKAVRASQGAILRMPFDVKLPEEMPAYLSQVQRAVWVADSKGEPLENAECIAPLALILGNEGHGVSSWAKSYAEISIPQHHHMESLNVAAAGAILLYTMRKRSHG